MKKALNKGPRNVETSSEQGAVLERLSTMYVYKK